VLIIIEVIQRDIANNYNCLHLPRSQASLNSVCLLPSRCGSDLTPLTTEKDSKPAVGSYGMDETGSQKDAALSLSDGGPLRQVRDQGGLESEGLTLRFGRILRGRSPHTSQISDTQALLESNTAAAQDQSVLSQSESQPAISHTVSTAERRSDLSLASLETKCSLKSLRLSHLLLLLA